MIDNLEIVTHNVETGKIDKFSINDLKAFYIHDTLEKVFEKVFVKGKTGFLIMNYRLKFIFILR